MIAMSEVTARQLEELVVVSFTCNTVYHKDHPFSARKLTKFKWDSLVFKI